MCILVNNKLLLLLYVGVLFHLTSPQYRVDIAPEEDRTFMKKKILQIPAKTLGGYLFDGTVLYSINTLTSTQKLTCELTSKIDDKVYTVTIRKEGEVHTTDYVYIQVYNLLVRHCQTQMGLKEIGREHYDPEAMIHVREHGLELWPGYSTSIRQHESGIMMCVEVTHKILRTDTVYNILKTCSQRNGSSYQEDFVKEILGCIIITKYNNRTYRIDDVDWKSSPESTFTWRGSSVTFADYMREKYQVAVRDMKQPLLVSRRSARDVRAGVTEDHKLIPELCNCTGFSDFMRKNNALMRDVARYTRIPPDTRVKKLKDFRERMQSSSGSMEKLGMFKMMPERDLVRLDGRLLPTESILLENRKRESAGERVDWTQVWRSNHMLISIPLTTWDIVVAARCEKDARAFVNMLQRAANGMGFVVSEPHWNVIERDNGRGFSESLNQITDRRNPQLIMCVVPNNRADTYSAVKKKLCVDRPVPSQVMLSRNLNDQKRSMSIATKVAIQINSKLGGCPWSVDVPSVFEGLMIVGYDVCHDTSNKKRSFGAMVASLDRSMSRYFSAVTPHQEGEELSNNFAKNIISALRKYKNIYHALPKKLFVYRDGVGEGQIRLVFEHELELIKRKIVEFCGKDQVALTFFVITKRINTRIFTEKLVNPPPGTVVDDVITDPEKFDFFLVSQSVRDGTVSPTGYNILCDESGTKPGYLQRLTYKFCHMYFNWSGTVKVPAPVQYAHKLAFLAGQALHMEPSEELDSTLYFL